MPGMRIFTIDGKEIIKTAPEDIEAEVEAFLRFIVNIYSNPHIIRETEKLIPLQSRQGDPPRLALVLTEFSIRFTKALAHIARKLEHVYPHIIPKLAAVLENTSNIIRETCLQDIYDLEAILAVLEMEKEVEREGEGEFEEANGNGNNIH